MKENRTNPFKQLQEKEKLPLSHKEKVMTSISIVELFSSVAELFTVNMAETAAKMTRIGTTNKKDTSKGTEKKT